MVATILVERMGVLQHTRLGPEPCQKPDNLPWGHENPALSECVARLSVDARGPAGFDGSRPLDGSGSEREEYGVDGGVGSPDRRHWPRLTLTGLGASLGRGELHS